jgi:hypothetical protein
MFSQINKKMIFKYIIILILVLVYWYISSLIIVFTLLFGFYCSAGFRLLICTGIPIFLLSKFFIKKMTKKKYTECSIIFLFMLVELLFFPYHIFRKDQAGNFNDFNTIVYQVIHDYYSPIFGR